jgi:hypothetical protein
MREGGVLDSLGFILLVMCGGEILCGPTFLAPFAARSTYCLATFRGLALAQHESNLYYCPRNSRAESSFKLPLWPFTIKR